MSRALMKRTGSSGSIGYILSPREIVRSFSGGARDGERASEYELEMLVDRSSVRKDLVDFQVRNLQHPPHSANTPGHLSCIFKSALSIFLIVFYSNVAGKWRDDSVC